MDRIENNRASEMSARYRTAFDREHGVGSIIETLGGPGVIHIFVHSLAALGDRAELVTALPGFESGGGGRPYQEVEVAAVDGLGATGTDCGPASGTYSLVLLHWEFYRCQSGAEVAMASWWHKAYWNAFTLWHVREEGRLPYRPLAEILAIQNLRVQAIIAHAYATVPYYREVMDQAGLQPSDFHTADDLARLPFLSGDQLARDPDRFLSRRYANGRSLRLHSSGTSGRLRKINYDPRALFLALAHGHRQRLVLAQFVGRKFGYREMVSTRPGSIGSRIRDFYESYSWVPRNVDLARSSLSPGDPFETNIARLNEFKPDILVGYGSYLGVLFRRAWEQQLPLFRPKVLFYGGDRMPDADRLLLENEFRVPVYSSYQAAETLRLAFQCERREGFHMSLDHVAVRVVDKDGNPVGPGETGEIVISNLTNRATVLLNYKLGDMVTLGSAPCPCGRTLPTIAHIDGRSDDLIALPSGEFIHSLTVLPPLHRVPGVIQVKLIQEDLQRFSLQVVCVGTVDWLRTHQELDTTLHSILSHVRTVNITRVDAIQPESGDKVKAVVSHCLP